MAAVDLAFGALGRVGNPGLVILHGLLGSSRNWMRIGKELVEYFNVFLVDMRNHGNSPHTQEMSYELMLEDLVEWVDRQPLEKFYLMGHSMGGKVAMAYACRYPERLKGLIVEDVSPVDYELRFQDEFRAMNELDLESLKTRAEADERLKEVLPDWEWRQFILTNLVRGEDKKFKWQINLETLTKHLSGMMLNSLRDGDVYHGPTLFLRGTNSHYIKDEDYGVIHNHFPRSIIYKVPHAGHNVHVDNREEVIKALRMFAEKIG